MATVTKADLVDDVAKVSNLTLREAELVVNTVFGSIADALAKGEKVELRGFGSFRVRRRNPRRGRNPKTGTRVDVPGNRVPLFKVGKAVRELINRHAARDRGVAPREPESARAGQPPAVASEGLDSSRYSDRHTSIPGTAFGPDP